MGVPHCGVETRNPKFCSSLCGNKFQRAQSDKRVEEGKGTHGLVKKYLIANRGYKCEGCEQSEIFSKGKLHELPLELEHKDGNSTNNTLENCELLCPACHALTETYKNRNKGNGRAKRRERYAAGLSY